jgi:hypothetical protein
LVRSWWLSLEGDRVGISWNGEEEHVHALWAQKGLDGLSAGVFSVKRLKKYEYWGNSKIQKS